MNHEDFELMYAGPVECEVLTRMAAHPRPKPKRTPSVVLLSALAFLTPVTSTLILCHVG